MRIMVDECLPYEVVDHLRRDGHDVHWISDDMSSVDDIVVLRAANLERRIIVSEDRDFGELVYRDGINTHGIILLRLDELPIPGVLARLSTAWSVIEANPAGRFIVITENKIRVRELPKS